MKPEEKKECDCKGIDFLEALTLLLIYLKVAAVGEAADLHWILVLAPLWMSAALTLLAIPFMIFYHATKNYIASRKRK